ncbi:MAG: hypothetical protein ACREF5_00740 [Candidatus Saccharimonadales bacterium]
MSLSGKLRVWLGVVVVGLLTFLLTTFSLTPVSAAQITTRSLTLEAGASSGGSDPGGVVNDLFNFTLNTSGNVGSIQFLYCTIASGTCITPTGLVTTSATMGTQSGATGFTLVNTTNGAPYITRTVANVTAPLAVSYQLLSVTNPTTANQTFYVRISTFASTDTTGAVTDTGNVAASTATQIVLSGIMPESLIFCTGQTVGTTSGIPDCTKATAGIISFDQLFSPTAAATATSQMAASTNAGSGYNITVNGTTLTSGGNTIPAMTSAGAAAVGNGQFGMNLVANTTASSTPAAGTAVAPSANGSTFKGQALAGYNTPDIWKYNSGDSVANSADGGAGPTNIQIFTVSYIVNVTGSQTAGTYVTTLTYICTATY